MLLGSLDLECINISSSTIGYDNSGYRAESWLVSEEHLILQAHSGREQCSIFFQGSKGVLEGK